MLSPTNLNDGGTGQVINIHPNGPVVGALERYQLRGGRANTAYEVWIQLCGGTNFLQTATLVTDKHGYGNVDPWKMPAKPANSTGAVPDGRALRWRYVSKDGKWVMVHDPTNDGSKTLPNWYFVHRGCVSLSNVD